MMTMKKNAATFLVLALVAIGVSSFSLLSPMARSTSSPTQLLAARPDTSAMVEEALKITATYGVSSKEAALAWESVEEMDASDNSQVTAPALDEECAIEDADRNPACQDYSLFLDELVNLQEIMPKKDNQKVSLVEVLKMIKLQPPQASVVKSSDKLAAALVDAKSATAQHGITSSEARLAWETYEEIASSGLENAIGVSLEEECSLESGQEACEAMEELERIMPVLQALSMSKQNA